MNARFRALLLGVAACAASSTALAQPQFIGIPGTCYDASDDGTVVVGATNAGAFRWVRTGSSATVTIIPGSTGGNPHCSLDGSVVLCDTLNGDDGNALNGLPTTSTVGGRWTAATGLLSIGAFDFAGLGTPNPPGVINTVLNASGSGDYVVGLGYRSATNFRGFIWSRATNVVTDLGKLGDGSWGMCVSEDGVVVGGRDRSPTTGADRPCYWRRDATGTYVETILFTSATPANERGIVSACSADGTILVGTSAQFSNQIVRWTWNGTSYVAAALGALPGNLPVTVQAMSADGSTIVGTGGNFFTGQQAFMWTPATGAVLLLPYMQSLGITGLPAGAAFGNAIGVSANGNAITVGGLGSSSGVVIRTGAPGCIQPSETIVSSTTQISKCSSTIIQNASASGTAPFTYLWRRNGVALSDGPTGTGSSITGSSTSQMRVNNAAPIDAATYDCIVTNACGSFTTAPRMVTAQAPDPFDTCAAASEVSGTGTVSLSMCGAYVDESPASCAGTQRADVWIRYTALQAGDYRITTCGQSNFDTILSAYDFCGGPEIACNDNFCGSLGSIERITLGLNQAVYVRLSAGLAIPGAPVTVGFELLPPPPANDLCANAQDISDSGSYAWDNTFALTDAAVSCNANSGKDVWFRFTPARSGTVTFDTCGSLLNTVLTALDSCGGSQLACNDNANTTGCTFQSAITNLPVTAQAPVLVRIGANTFSGAGSGNLNVAFTPSGFCPTDLNQDGVTDPDDLSDAISCFFDPGCSFDYDASGFEDPDDLSTYIAEFFTPGSC